MSDHELIMKKAGKEGRSATLNFLEQMAISQLKDYKIHIN